MFCSAARTDTTVHSRKAATLLHFRRGFVFHAAACLFLMHAHVSKGKARFVFLPRYSSGLICADKRLAGRFVVITSK